MKFPLASRFHKRDHYYPRQETDTSQRVGGHKLKMTGVQIERYRFSRLGENAHGKTRRSGTPFADKSRKADFVAARLKACHSAGNYSP